MPNQEVMTEAEITRIGNPGKPQGDEGSQMLRRMNESHFAVTGWALEHWTIQGNEQVLDIGCGGGATLHRLADQITTGHLTGVDYSEVSVAVSSETNAESIASGKMKVVHGSVEKLPFDDNSFDRIITVESFYFWPNPAENLKEVLRVLKPGGQFLLVADVYNREGLSQSVLDNVALYHLFNPTKEEFHSLCTNAGFSGVQVFTQDQEGWICTLASKQ